MMFRDMTCCADIGSMAGKFAPDAGKMPSVLVIAAQAPQV
jgi:hypothetical protein